MPIKPTPPPLWQNTLDLTAATIPPGSTLSLPPGAGGGSGTVTAVTGTAPIASSGGTSPDISLDNSGVTAATYGDATHVGTFTVDAHGLLTFAGNVPIAAGITALTGDGTATGPGSAALTLATVNSNVGSFANATVTANAKGLITAISAGSTPSNVAIVTETGTTRTAILTDANSLILCTNASGCTITIPPQSSVAWASGSIIYARQDGAAQVTFAAGAGVTFDPDVDSNKTRKIGSVIAMQRTASDTWCAVGDMEYDIAATSVQANATNVTAAPTAFAATADQQRLRRENGVLVWEGEWAAGGGTADAITATIPTSGTFTLQDGALYGVRATAANATTTPTLALNAGTARTITKFGNVPLGAGDIYGAGHECLFRYVSATPRFELLNPAASSGTSTTSIIAQTTHGFAVGDVIRLSGSATYTKAQADSSANAEVVGMVSLVPDANHFSITTCGFVAGLSGKTAGTVYFLDPTTAGALTATEPTTVGQISKPVFVADTTTSGYFFNMRGEVILSKNFTGNFASASVVTSQTTASTSFTDLATVGPSVTLNTGTSVVVFLTAFSNNTLAAGNTSYLSVAVSGATTLAAAVGNDVRASGPGAGFNFMLSGAVLLTGLTAGLNTFTVKYKVDGSTFLFGNRNITVTCLN